MLSPDLLGILMRGIQAQHHDWGMGPDAGIVPEEDFAALMGEGGEDAGARAVPAVQVEEAALPAEGEAAEADAAGEEVPVEVPDLLVAAGAALRGKADATAIPAASARLATGHAGTASPGAAAAEDGARAEAEAPPAEPEAAGLGGAGRTSADAPLPQPPAQGTGGIAVQGPGGAPAFEMPPAWRMIGEAEPGVATRAGGSTPSAAAATPASVAGQVAVAIAGANGDRVEIRLDPPELGRVQIALRVIDGALTAVVLAERAEVADMLRRHAEGLERDLAAAGYEDVTLSFGDGRAEDDAEDREARPGVAPTVEAGRPVPHPAAAIGQADGRLDIRL
jgi:flagellar hook-length control protein FliK